MIQESAKPHFANIYSIFLGSRIHDKRVQLSEERPGLLIRQII